MRVIFERTGGFAGIRMTKTIDIDTLPESERNHLQLLIEAADFFELPEIITSANSQPDRFQYQITVEKSQRQHRVRVSEQAVPDTLRPFLEWLIRAK
ncbi:protealysin inhibitor emfourin [Aerosakkonemataceae cyanobacterium BLCC-F50]|uniref:Protealysin inhibitor emfourin n=1 Tax=Floridaenema flaviceps BLCC-F50 TaxID=3153642 RepID=A0ABV4XZ72_9CYAN